ncbi:MAG: cytochrome c-type biogenesis protein CcmH [Acidobacteria bacterium]|nr:cytochrome c-type biogenesis protein CcmH [Acidobacteriota bacterium]
MAGLLLVLLPLVYQAWAQNTAEQSAADEATFRRVSNRLLCQCGCNYMVLSCNHLDCSSATYIRNTIRASLSEGKTEDAIVASFVEEYGPKILPEPPRQGFSWMAWIMPFAALVLGGGVVSYVLWLWKWKPAEDNTAGATPADSAQPTPEQDASSALVEKYRAQIDEELDKE